MTKFRYPLIFCLGFLNFLTCYADSPQEFRSFMSEFVWVDPKICKIPKAKAPEKLMIYGIDFNHLSRKRSYRRWIDVDGDGICELYDIAELQSSAFTGKIYGIPTRAFKFENNAWKKFGGGAYSWIPMILLDKKRERRIIIDYVYGNAGYSLSLKSVPIDCEDLRQYLGVGAMLYFNFPMMARLDELTNPEGEWNDVKSGWFSSFYTEKEEIMNSGLPSSCKEKYRVIIDALYKRLEK